jgi:YHS domain-containing protein
VIRALVPVVWEPVCSIFRKEVASRTTHCLNMKKVLFITLLAIVFASTVSAKTLLNKDRNGVGIKGYDPVAYFTHNKAVKGNAQFQSSPNGITYHFASAQNKAAFDADPAKYEPQFGGFCAWAVSQGYTAPIDPNAFQVVNGRLLLQYSLSVRKQFSQDTEGNLRKADANWPAIVEKKGK